MAEETTNRRISTTPIPVPIIPGSIPPAPTPSPLSQRPVSNNDQPTTQAAEAVAAAVAEKEAAEMDTAEKDMTMTDTVATTDPATVPLPDSIAADKTATPTGIASGNGGGGSPAPARTSTPLRATNGQEPAQPSSRAASQHPDSGFTMPPEAPEHGAHVRQYLNSKVTGSVLEGMKLVAKEKPNDPLRVLGEFLIQRSKELESSA